ncbi:DNA-formamidopyrimidine glycosylase family protein [Microbacterium terricola]|uniref:Formamidopyrimidine-DNA glycosylase n=1 Tax=Microbacterium terricola TaxID=344163 RepID=A0ABM8DZW6_9MICO|nr:DNA-formamidopyrimidine glycosylase family protein [Microbacterium terricola]UYK41188.1 Fpg/Nei family DNA glycosylase [Microbacterium terricola]BDV31040.1 formamidopyrimidine-DNA glycosylase [Microbacterium terricola]
MPESPEVQALAEFLDARTRSGRIEGIDLDEFRALKTRQRPLTELAGATISAVRRFGKHLDVQTDAAHLVISFGRAGWARWNGEAAPGAAPVIGRIAVGDDLIELTDAGEWLSIGLSVVDDPAEVAAIAKLGPDPAEPGFTRSAFDHAVVGRRKQLKALLQEQESFAGIGNAYSDEILHAAKLPPAVQAASLDEEQRDRLFSAMTSVVRDAVAARRSIPPHELKAAKVAAMRVHGRGGEVCPVCGDVIVDQASSSTSSQHCPTCQLAQP